MKTKICNDMENELEKSCAEFPRFYYLEKEDLFETLSFSRDCRKYLETVKKCFNGVKDLIYSLPSKKNPINHKVPNSNTNNNGHEADDTTNQINTLDFDIYGTKNIKNES